VTKKSIIIIGAGLAGLSTGCYSQMNGYQTHIFEHHAMPGGVATCWKRKGYTIDGGIHFLMCHKPCQSIYEIYRELGTAQSNRFLDMTSYFHFIDEASGATLTIPQVTEEAFDNLLNIHFKGVYFLTQKSLPNMNDNGGVVFISSGTTRFCVHGYSVYSSLKAAVEVFAKYVAKEFGQRGIRANVVAPGAIETDFNNATIRNNPQMKSFVASQTALGRVGNADDIGSVVAFLCTDEAKWINGQRIEVSGGVSL
jgi:hypothetical protein